MMTRHKRRTPAVIESLESRRLLSSSMLHTVGNHLVDASGQTVRLTGVNIPSLAWSNVGENVLQSLGVAVNTWKSNCIRLALTQDSWEGHTGSGSGAAYQTLVDSVVSQAQSLGIHVVLDLHWSDEGSWGSNVGQHDMPDDNSTTFWHDVATHYANNSAVLFGLYNEPHDGSWSVWENGGTVTEGSTQYHTPGMQALINTVRATGANNIVVAGGLSWSANDSGVLSGYALSDTTGNGIVYDAHVYPWTGNWDTDFGNVSNTYPVLAGEVGAPPDNDPNFSWAGSYPSDRTWMPSVLTYLDSHNVSWTAWAFYPGDLPGLISDWNYTPTSYFGQYIYSRLLSYRGINAAAYGWSDSDIGSPGIAGSGSYNGTTWTVTGSGTGISSGSTSDQFNFASTSVTGDQTLITQVTSMTNTNAWAESGLMFRDSSAVGAMQVSLLATPGNGVALTWRGSTNGTNSVVTIPGVGMPTTSNPVWLKLVKSGSTYTASYATGTSLVNSWTLVGSASVSLSNSTYLAGLAVTSHNTGAVDSSTMAYTYIIPTQSVALPVGWSDSDVGLLVGDFGSGTYNGTTMTVSGSGAGILGGGRSDQFNFASTPETGDQTLIARATSLTSTNAPSAEAGAMFRDSPAPGAMQISLLCRPGTIGIAMVWRTSTNGINNTVNVPGVPAPTPSNPVWLKLVRSGSGYSAYYATGIGTPTTWTQVGSTVTMSFSNSTYMAGLAVTSHNSGSLNVTSTFDNVNDTWLDADIGSPGKAGSASFDGATYTVKGGGGSWGTSDQFNFMNTAQTGSGTLVAAITGVDSTEKAGILFRDSSAANAMFADVCYCAATGVNFQWRSSTGGAMSNATISGIPAPTTANPLWVKLVRSGNVFSGYYSTNGGTTWTQIGSSVTINMNNTYLAGLFVNARNNTKLSTGTFTNLLLT
jgi:hypothetical protein